MHTARQDLHNGLPVVALEAAIFCIGWQLGLCRASLVSDVLRVYCRHLNDSFKWLFYGDDDTVFFLEGAMKTVANLDHNMPYFLTGARTGPISLCSLSPRFVQSLERIEPHSQDAAALAEPFALPSPSSMLHKLAHLNCCISCRFHHCQKGQ